MATDPVCQMEVREVESAPKYEYKGKTYYFCDSSCQQAFEQNPEKYLEDEE